MLVRLGAPIWTNVNCPPLWGMVQRQAAIQAFLDAFLLLAVVFLAMAPLLMIMKKPQHHDEPAAGAAVE